MSLKKFSLLILILLLATPFAIYMSVPDLKWRADILGLKITGHIDDVPLSDLLAMLKPGSGFWLKPLAQTRNPYSSIHNPHTADKDISKGADLFSQNCVKCHGAAGGGDVGPSLTQQNYSHGDSDWSIFTAIRDGIDGTAMPKHSLQDREVWSLVAYIRSLQRSTDTGRINTKLDVPAVTHEMLVAAKDTPENWLTYSGTYNGHRFSGLNKINTNNAHTASIKWVHQFTGDRAVHEASPIVVGETMFVTESPNIVHALNAETGKLLWSYEHKNESDLKLCCGQINRGVAIYENTVYMGTLDSSLIALDASSGKLIWDVDLHDHRLGSSITPAPLVVDGKVIVGYGGGDLGFRGFLDAVDAKTGEKLWRLHTIPGEGEPGNETWSGDSWKTGGGGTWLTGTYEEETRRLYWNVGNPGPLYQGDLRQGDNLYSDSVLAIDIDTGKLIWHFQYTPHDVHDWAANQIPVLVDKEWNGKQRRLLIQANRNAFFYVLDRDTGEFLLAKPFAKQNWAKSIDENGRPILNPDTIISHEGVITWPSPIGGTNWWSPSYSPVTELMYVPALEYGQIVFKDIKPAVYQTGDYFLGGGHRPIPGDETLYFAVRAINPDTGDIVWEYKNPSRPSWWKTGGLVSTAGSVVFGGDNTDFFILDAATGEELWRRNVGGRINASPVTYEVNGTQYFAMAAGRSIVTISID